MDKGAVDCRAEIPKGETEIVLCNGQFKPVGFKRLCNLFRIDEGEHEIDTLMCMAAIKKHGHESCNSNPPHCLVLDDWSVCPETCTIKKALLADGAISLENYLYQRKYTHNVWNYPKIDQEHPPLFPPPCK